MKFPRGVIVLIGALLPGSPGLAQQLEFVGEQLEHPSTTYSTRTEIGDVDLDGDLDVVAASGGVSAIRTHRNLGNGSFAPPLTSPTFFVSHESGLIGLEDVDLDGDCDALFLSTGALFTASNSGTGSFGSALAVGSSSSVGVFSEAIVGDVDQNGRMDVLVGREVSTNALGLMLGKTTGGFQNVAYLNLPGQIDQLALGDINADGKVDLAIATKLYEQNLRVYAGQGNGTFTLATTISLPDDSNGLATGDLDGDGRADVAVSVPQVNQVRFFFGTAAGLGAGGFVATPKNHDDVTIGDLDGDGHLDLIVGSTPNFVSSESLYEFSFYRNNGLGQFAQREPIECAFATARVAVTDLDGDPHPDLLLTPSMSVLRGDPAGEHGGTAYTTTAYTVIHGNAVHDWNGDGRQDVVQATVATATSGGALGAFAGTGGGLVPVPLSPLPLIPNGGIGVGDANADGFADVVTWTESTGNLALSLANGQFGFQTQLLPSVPIAVRDAILADLTGDGADDLIATGGLAIVRKLADGVGGFTSLANYATADAGHLNAGDVDLDGDLDVLHGGFRLACLLNDGVGNLGAPIVAITNEIYFDRPHPADLNLDGFPDVGVAGQSELLTGTSFAGAGAYLGNGTGNFLMTSKRVVPVGLGSFAADIDADGLTDLVTTTTYGLAVFGIDSKGNMSERAYVCAPHPSAPVCVDIDGDSLLDLACGTDRGIYVAANRSVPAACPGTITVLPGGCPGKVKFIPKLLAAGCATPGGPLHLAIESGLGGAPGFLLLGPFAGSIALGSGCTLQVVPIVTSFPVVLMGSGPGLGELDLTLGIPSGILGGVVLQAVILDSASPIGAAVSNGLRIDIQ